MPYQPIIGTLGYVISQDGAQVLLLHRTRPGDHHGGKYNGFGGKLEPSESVSACMRRELREESGLEAAALNLRGTVNWPGFGPNGEDWLGFIFVIAAYSGLPFAACAEGSIAWHPLEDLLAGRLPIWEGDKYFLPLVFDGDPRPFHGVMPYRSGWPLGWSFER